MSRQFLVRTRYVKPCLVGLVGVLGLIGCMRAEADVESPSEEAAVFEDGAVLADDAFYGEGEDEAEFEEEHAGGGQPRQGGTHRQTMVLRAYADAESSQPLAAFCLNANGEILACCGNGPGEVRVLDDQGKLIRSWKVPVKPESIHAAADNTVLVGGMGKLFRYRADGELLAEVDSPHAKALQDQSEEMRAEAKQQLLQQSGSLSGRIAMYTQIIDALTAKQEKGELSPDESQILEMLPQQLEAFKKAQADRGNEEESGPTEEAIAEQVRAMTQTKLRIASISSDGDHVYIATPSLTGYTYDLWRLSTDMEQGEIIVSGLRGCCGQMDVQAGAAGIFAAENSRHRVVSYAPDGTQKQTWGGRARTGIDGFSSCCNPMNVCFNQKGDVFTAEASTGRIKKFSADGEMLAYIGDVELVPGCKNVSIAVSPDENRVYMLDITRNHIVVMERTGKASDAR